MVVARLLTLLAGITVISAYTHGNDDSRPGRLSLQLHKNNAFEVRLGNYALLASSNVFMNINNKTYSTDDGTLHLVDKTMDKGSDALGKWQATRYQFRPAGLKNRMIASIYTYTDQPFMLFEQRFPDGAEETSTEDENKVCTGFPSFEIPTYNQTMGFHAFGGIMFGNTYMRTGRWGGNMTTMPVSGLDSGPLLLFDSKDNAVVVSSFTNFMSGSVMYGSSPKTASWGLLGKAQSIPKGFQYSVIVYHSDRGIREAVSGWGYTLRKYYNRHTQFRDSDFSNNYLGYYTDNGAYYYYKTEPNKTYDETLYDVQNYANSLNIPYRYVQYDSWWYYKGPKDGVTKWVSMDKIFPKGMRAVWNRTQWTSVAHNRWWSDKTVYAKKNGGKYNFIIEPQTHKALPVDQAFWDDMMLSSRQWGLITYEQDWLNVQFNEMEATVSDVRLGRTWLRQMGQAAAKTGLTIQYCMSPSRHALQTLEIPVVSQARVSTDYLLSPEQWRIGISSMFALAMGVAPFKDNFWTITVQPDNPYNKTEPRPILQALVATLSTGPVAPSDKIGFSNASLIMRSCDSTGRLLKPARPALAINDQIKMAAIGRPLGEVWTTYSQVSGLMFGIILAADMKSDYSIGPTKARFGQKFPKSRVFGYNSRAPGAAIFSDSSPLHLSPSCGPINFCLFHTTPILTWQGQELLLYGELDKWVPMSSQRFKTVTVSTSDVRIELEGGAGEKVNLTLVYGGKWMTFSCLLGSDGTAKFSLVNKMCSSG